MTPERKTPLPRTSRERRGANHQTVKSMTRSSMPETGKKLKAIYRGGWFRMYAEILDDYKIQCLSPHLLRTWLNLLALTCRYGGRLPGRENIAFVLRMSIADANSHLDDLIDVGLVDILPDGSLLPHNWFSRQPKPDLSTARVRKHRMARKRVSQTSETRSETDTETEEERSETYSNLISSPTTNLSSRTPVLSIQEEKVDSSKGTYGVGDRTGGAA